MSPASHKTYIITLTAIVVIAFLGMAFLGAGYYSTSMEERYFHEQHDLLKPTGFIGHGTGIAGSFFMVVGVFGYMARKRIRRFSGIGKLKYWLEFHIFLCTLGPVLVLFHTSFKFGGMVAISFWSMVAVVFSGIIGRFIYLQIPRTIQGRELSLSELKNLENELFTELIEKYKISHEILSKLNNNPEYSKPKSKNLFIIRIIKRFWFEHRLLITLNAELKAKGLSGKNYREVLHIFKSKIILRRRIEWLVSMENFLRYWHVIHLPFALIMLVIMIVHIIVALLFGYKWIF